MKMVETQECAEADQPEVRSTSSGFGDPVNSKICNAFRFASCGFLTGHGFRLALHQCLW